jgi:23S rRNA pseudouridine1911/1915/1917 synthase
MNYQEIKITCDEPLALALAKAFPDTSKATLKKWIVNRRVALGSKPMTKPSMPVKKGHVLRLYDKQKKGAGKLPILYADSHIVVVDKPCGLLSVSTYYEQQDTAHDILKSSKKYGRVFPVHRLDRETSGVMVFAISDQARQNLKEQFHSHSIDREYHAIVEGVIEKEKGVWKHRLIEDANYVMRPGAKGALSITHFSKALSSKKYSYLVCHLETGKKNQIRVGASFAGHPIIGDTKYGAGPSPIGRLGLHAFRLGFKHPATGKQMTFASKPPSSFTYLFPSQSAFFAKLKH